MSCGRAICDERCRPASRVGAADAGRIAAGLARAVAVAGAAVAGVASMTVAGGGSRYGRRGRGAASLRLVSRLMLRSLSVRIQQSGTPASGACLVVANHTSWLDVLVLAAAGPIVPVAKDDIAGWPVLGRVARRAGTIFVRRENWRALPAVVDELTTALRRGHRVQVFPEGTTRCGEALRPFHRAAFQAAIDAAVPIAPAAISYRDESGARTAIMAFLGDDDLVTSLRRILAAAPVTVQVAWLPLIPAVAATGVSARDRALAAARAEHAVAQALDVPVLRRVPATAVPAPVRLPVPAVAESQLPAPRPAGVRRRVA